MYHSLEKQIVFIAFLTIFSCAPLAGFAQESPAPAPTQCENAQPDCMLSALAQSAQSIEREDWRDQSLREAAKAYAYYGHTDEALALLPQIKDPDTQAMTIRGIGMSYVDYLRLRSTDDNPLYLAPGYAPLFKKLREHAETIKHPPSYAIALTYIAMAQAFADDDEGAWKTTADMENDALRHKALGEMAEIQAEKGRYDAAMDSISRIKESSSFQDKAYNQVSKRFANIRKLDEAFRSALKISNPYKRGESIQYILHVKTLMDEEVFEAANPSKSGDKWQE